MKKIIPFLILILITTACYAAKMANLNVENTADIVDLNVTGTLTGDGSNLSGVSSSSAYDDIAAPDNNSTIAFAGFVNSWTTNETASDFFNITNSGNFGDVSLMVLQETGNATDGTMLEIISTDTDVDKLVINGTQLVVRGSGNVGVGTNAPLALLHVGVGGTPGSASTGDVYIRNDLEVDGTIYGDGSGITGIDGGGGAANETQCIFMENPQDTDDLKSIWFVNKATTLNSIWCESDQTVNLDLQVDDGTPADVNGTDLVCDSTPAHDTSLGGDATMSDGDRLDVAITSVSGAPTWVSICWEYSDT